MLLEEEGVVPSGLEDLGVLGPELAKGVVGHPP